MSKLSRLLIIMTFLFTITNGAIQPVEAYAPNLQPTPCGENFIIIVNAYIDEANPDAHFGDDTRLRIKADPRAGQIHSLLTFDISSLPADVMIHSAQLQLTVGETGISRSDAFQVSNITETWDGNTVTWNSRPNFQANRQTTLHTIEGGVLSLDVTTLVRAWQSSDRLPQSLLVQPRSDDMDISFYSANDPDSARHPRLAISCAVSREAPPTDRTGRDQARQTALDSLRSDSTEPVEVHFGRGAVQHAGFNLVLPPAAGDDVLSRSRWLLNQRKDLFGLDNPAQELQLTRLSPGGNTAFYRQVYEGVPVYGAYLAVNLQGNEARYVSGNYYADFLPGGEPTLTAEEAEAIALESVGPPGTLVGETQLRYYIPYLAGFDAEGYVLVWQVNIEIHGDPFAFLVDAQTGTIVFVETRLNEGLNVDVRHAANLSEDVDCDILSYVTTLWFDEDGPVTSGYDSDGLNAWNYIKDTYNHWFYSYNHDSYNGIGGKIWMFVNVGNPYENASSNNDCLKFGTGWVTNDIVGHEFAHSVDRNEANLIYSGQTGALDESYADTFGYFVDPEDWLIGEDLAGGPLRSMSDPPAYGQPDHMLDYANTTADNGGVHTNSGIRNKVVYLMTDGGQFNGYNITGLGEFKVRKLMYHIFTGCLGPTSGFDHDRNCAVSIAQGWANFGGTYGFTSNNVCQIKNAYAAVGIGQGDADCDGTPNNQEPDNDNDGVVDILDNCVSAANSSQADTDGDGAGDLCDDDDDDDNVLDAQDNCPLVKNSGQEDQDGDGTGDHCDDNDGDGVVDTYDNCAGIFNPDQKDLDSDGYGDLCDVDQDGDGVLNIPANDNCPLHPNPGQENDDLDQYGNVCDLCPAFPSNINTDNDNDGLGDPCDPDDDNDGVPDENVLGGGDNCPLTPNPDQVDIDGDGIGLKCDPDEQQMLELPLNTNVFIPEDLPFQIQVPICPNCGAEGLPADWQVNVTFNMNAAAYAHIFDNQGQVVARSVADANGNHELNFSPVPFSELAGPANRAASARPGDNEARYTLEIHPLEDPNGDRTYDLSWEKEEGEPLEWVYLPMVIR